MHPLYNTYTYIAPSSLVNLYRLFVMTGRTPFLDSATQVPACQDCFDYPDVFSKLKSGATSEDQSGMVYSTFRVGL